MAHQCNVAAADRLGCGAFHNAHLDERNMCPAAKTRLGAALNAVASEDGHEEHRARGFETRLTEITDGQCNEAAANRRVDLAPAVVEATRKLEEITNAVRGMEVEPLPVTIVSAPELTKAASIARRRIGVVARNPKDQRPPITAVKAV
ncbi:MAG: hypothetical protein ACR2NZ_07840 [Rubripirellula sp.]